MMTSTVVGSSSRLGKLLCGQGFHKWRFLWMKDKRMITVAPWSDWVCTIAESCARPSCRIRRTREHAKLPKRVKV